MSVEVLVIKRFLGVEKLGLETTVSDDDSVDGQEPREPRRSRKEATSSLGSSPATKFRLLPRATI